MSKICPKCGRELQDESLFCVNCGQSMVCSEFQFQSLTGLLFERVW